MNATTASLNLPKVVRILNEQHRTTSAGFYGSSRVNGRFFRARLNKGVLEVYDFENWFAVPTEDIAFHDHTGRDISLS